MDMLNNPLNNLGPIQQAQNILRQTSPGYQVREYCENLGGRGIVEDVMEKMIPLYSLRKQEEENLRMVEESGLVTYLKDKSSPSTLEPVKSYLERYWEEREREKREREERESLERYLEERRKERERESRYWEGIVEESRQLFTHSTLEPVKSYLERYWEERERERRESLGRYLEKSERERRESLGIYFLKDYLKE